MLLSIRTILRAKNKGFDRAFLLQCVREKYTHKQTHRLYLGFDEKNKADRLNGGEKKKPNHVFMISSMLLLFSIAEYTHTRTTDTY